jgi:hypothetical protein
MKHEMTTNLTGAEVLVQAKRFFAERVPHLSAFLEKEGDNFAIFRGQGGEELTVAVFESADGTRVRASTLLFDQAVGRFFSTLPGAGDSA